MLVKTVYIPKMGEVSVELPENCPICRAAISPNVIYSVRNRDLFSDSSEGITAALACPACHKLFVAYINGISGTNRVYHLLDVAPSCPPAHEFDPSMGDISPAFVEIYHQAEAAQVYNLDQISGIGYRKALEFLIKDYAIHLHPGNEKAIKEAPLAQCIERYIDHPKIKATAKAAAWLGNDETHYIRKWEDRDIEDLKKFISACVFWILADHAFQDAVDMTTA